jgi:hypothetical protein
MLSSCSYQTRWCGGDVVLFSVEGVGSDIGQDIAFPEYGFSLFQSPQVNVGDTMRFWHYRFLPNPFQFIFHHSSYYRGYTVRDTDSVFVSRLYHKVSSDIKTDRMYFNFEKFKNEIMV